jgi:3-keto-disaccharide hydrolase
MKNLSSLKLHFLRFILLTISFFSVNQSKANHSKLIQKDSASLIGRWDMTLYMDGKELPSWLEVQLSGTRTLVGQYVGTGGSARPISKIIYNDGEMNFSIPPQWEKENNDISFNGKLEGDSLVGTVISADGKSYKWSAVRAPFLKRTAEPIWQKPIPLFNGKDLTGWHASGNTNQWIVKDGVLSSPHSGANLLTDKTFNDFKLHIEFRYPNESNSGVYLRGRYEVQIEDAHGDEPYKDVFSAIYGFIAPSEMAAKPAGEWQSYDITLVGRMVTIVANGKTVICNREIPGITGGAINSKEGEPGPLMIQGDHGPIEYRNIVITQAK